MKLVSNYPQGLGQALYTPYLISLPPYLFICLSIYLSAYLSICPLSIYLSIYLSVRLAIYLT